MHDLCHIVCNIGEPSAKVDESIVLIIHLHTACLISNISLPALVFHMTCVSLTFICINSAWCLLCILLMS